MKVLRVRRPKKLTVETRTQKATRVRHCGPPTVRHCGPPTVPHGGDPR